MIITFVAIVIITVEIILTHKIRMFRRINEHSWFSGLALSLFLGWAVGMILGLSGVIVGMASALALVVTDSIWAAKRKILKESKTGEPNQLVRTVNEVIAFWSLTFKILKVAAIIITAPIWIPAKTYAFLTSNPGKVQPS